MVLEYPATLVICHSTMSTMDSTLESTLTLAAGYPSTSRTTTIYSTRVPTVRYRYHSTVVGQAAPDARRLRTATDNDPTAVCAPPGAVRPLTEQG